MNWIWSREKRGALLEGDGAWAEAGGQGTQGSVFRGRGQPLFLGPGVWEGVMGNQFAKGLWNQGPGTSSLPCHSLRDQQGAGPTREVFLSPGLGRRGPPGSGEEHQAQREQASCAQLGEGQVCCGPLKPRVR